MAMAMTMAELRGRLRRSFENMFETSRMDQMMVNSCVKDITDALIDADFPRSLVNEIDRKCQIVVNARRGTNKGQLIYKV